MDVGFPVPSRDVTYVSDIPAGDGKTAYLFLQCIVIYYFAYSKFPTF
jgi:hypothetical protein